MDFNSWTSSKIKSNESVAKRFEMSLKKKYKEGHEFLDTFKIQFQKDVRSTRKNIQRTSTHGHLQIKSNESVA